MLRIKLNWEGNFTHELNLAIPDVGQNETKKQHLVSARNCVRKLNKIQKPPNCSTSTSTIMLMTKYVGDQQEFVLSQTAFYEAQPTRPHFASEVHVLVLTV